MQHQQFQDLLDTLVTRSGVGQELMGEALARTSIRAPSETSRVELAAGDATDRRPAGRRAIAQGTISKAVKALLEEGLLEDGERFQLTRGGRPVAPLCFGSLYAMAGVKVVQMREQPRSVTTALLGLDTSRVLGTVHDAADSWDQVVELIHQQVTSLTATCNEDRADHGLVPLRMFGMGVGVGAPVRDGEVMPLASEGHEAPIQLSVTLHRLFEADPNFDTGIPVIVENDVNALAVLSVHGIDYAVADLVVVGVFDERVGGGLIMDGQLRRGSKGRSMQIGHLAVGHDLELREPHLPNAKDLHPSASDAGFGARCSCGHFGHVDTLATPRRIQEEFSDGTLEQMSQIDHLDSRFKRALEIFTRSGTSLGRAMAHVGNTVNPSKIVIYLPAPLAQPKPGTAAAAYLTSVRAEATRVIAASNQRDYLTIRSFPVKPKDAALLEAKAAAVCVLETFIEHALRLDGCTTGLRRTAAGDRTSVE